MWGEKGWEHKYFPHLLYKWLLEQWNERIRPWNVNVDLKKRSHGQTQMPPYSSEMLFIYNNWYQGSMRESTIYLWKELTYKKKSACPSQRCFHDSNSLLNSEENSPQNHLSQIATGFTPERTPCFFLLLWSLFHFFNSYDQNVDPSFQILVINSFQELRALTAAKTCQDREPRRTCSWSHDAEEEGELGELPFSNWHHNLDFCFQRGHYSGFWPQIPSAQSNNCKDCVGSGKRYFSC